MKEHDNTYSFSDIDAVLESRDGFNSAVLSADLDDLAASDVGIGSVVEESRRECWSFGDAGRVEKANQDVVIEQCLDQTLLSTRAQNA